MTQPNVHSPAQFSILLLSSRLPPRGKITVYVCLCLLIIRLLLRTLECEPLERGNLFINQSQGLEWYLTQTGFLE